MQLRPYQKGLFDKVSNSFKSGNRRVLVQSPCGSGKTVLMTYMAAATQKSGKNTWIILPRQEIMEQTYATFEKCGVSLDKIYIGMTMTTANRIGELPKPDLILYDECHISVANTYWKISNAFPESWIVGATASPCRTDNRPLGDLYEDMVEGVSVKWLIENQCLSPYRYYSVPVVNDDVIDSNSVHYEDVLMKPAVYGNVVDSYRRFANGMQTVIYCTSVKHSKETAKTFNSAGIAAVHIDGGTPQEKRKSIIEDFRIGKVKVLCNCDLISMGFDMPDIGCVILLRPTNSTALHIQQSGRALRYKPGKEAVIIDMVGNYTRHGLPDDEHEWSLTQSVKRKPPMDSSGNLYIRTCPNCFQIFKTADVCPYCGEPYPLSAREIKAHEEIELKKIEAEEMEKLAEVKKRQRMEVGRARTIDDLWRIAKERNYAPGWVYKMAKVKGIQ